MTIVAYAVSWYVSRREIKTNITGCDNCCLALHCQVMTNDTTRNPVGLIRTHVARPNVTNQVTVLDMRQ